MKDYRIKDLNGWQGTVEPGDRVLYQDHRVSFVARPVDPEINDPDADVYRHTVLISQNAAIMMYIDEMDDVYFAKQNRPAMRREMLAFPAETLDKPGQTPLEVMAEGLVEECGVLIPTSQIEYVCSLDSTDGHDTEMVHCFRGWGKGEYVGQKLEDTEEIEVVKMSFNDAYSLMKENVITGAKTSFMLEYEQNRRLSDRINNLEMELARYRT